MTEFVAPALVGQPPFFVMILESPSPDDLKAGRQEGPALEEILCLLGIPVYFRTVDSKASLGKALKELHGLALAKHPGHKPVLHLSAHGGGQCFGLSDGSTMSFGEFAALVKPVYDFHGSLLLCLSSCSGAEYVGTAMVNPPEFDTFFAMVSSWGSPTWQETAVGFATFYHLMRKGYDIPDAVVAMRSSAGHGDFTCARADRARKRFLKLLGGQESSGS